MRRWRSSAPTVRSEARVTRVALPHVAAGSVVEQELTLGERAPVRGGGQVYLTPLAGPAPVLHMTLAVSRPTKARAVVAVRGPSVGATPRDRRVGDRTITTLEARGLAPQPDIPVAAPADHVPVPLVLVATGASWAAVAAAYRAVNEERTSAR